MRIQAFIAVTLLSLPVHAAQVTPFNKDCLENEANIIAMQAQPAKAGIKGEVCHYGQLTAEDLSYVKSVQPSANEPVILPVIKGEVCQYGQLTQEDLSFVESVQPSNAVRQLHVVR
jgi:hypothetical protein